MNGIKVFGGQSHPKLVAGICDYMGMTPGKMRFVRFSNDNLMVQVEENVREADVFVVQTSAPPVDQGLIELFIILDALKRASAGRVTAVLPYFPYARSDKKDKPRIPITARLMAKLIERAGADRVLTMDLHSPQIEGFFDIPTDHLRAVALMIDYWKTRDLTDHVAVSADAGHAKETGPFAGRLQLPMAIIDKRRYGDDDKAVPVSVIGDVRDKHCLMFDDEVASANTLIEGAEFLKKHGALTVKAACTHPVLSGKAVEKLKNGPIDELVVTDTIPTNGKEFDRLKVLTVAPLFGKAIRRIHEGDSVHELWS